MMHNNTIPRQQVKAQNGANSVNGQPIQKINQPMKPQNKDPSKPKNPQKPLKNPEKRKDAGPKSPAPRKAKEIQYVKIMIVQQYFKNDDLKGAKGQEEEEPFVAEVDVDEGEKQEQAEDQTPAEGEEKPDENQIDSGAVANVEEEQQPDEPVEEEQHEDYQESNQDDQENTEPYDPTAEMQLDVNRTNKVKSLKRAILEKVKLNSKTNIIIFKKNDGQIDSNENAWVPLTEQDNE